MTNADWQRYLAAFHADKAGVTERVLAQLEGFPYAWLVEPLHDTAGWIVDVACGSAPTRDQLAGHRWVGVDLSADELAAAATAGRGPLVRARADVLPVADGAADAVCAAMSLQVVTPLVDALAEIIRVLRPGGLLVALVPARPGVTLRGWLGWARVLRALGVTSQPWPNPDACDGLAKLLSRHGFTLISSERRSFRFPMQGADSAALLVESLYLPGTSAERIATAEQVLASWARPGRWLPLPLRRVVARR